MAEKLLPGIWYAEHRMSYDAQTFEDMINYVNHVHNLAASFPCAACKPHFLQYLKTHSFDRYYGMKDRKGQPIGMFYYMWEFHNSVNKRLGKPLLDFETAYAMYAPAAAICSFGCALG